MITFSKIPNCPIYPWWQLSPIYRSYVEGDPVSEFIKDGFRADVASYGIVINTFSGLEGVYLNYLSKELGHERVWSIGPLLPPDDVGPVERGGPSEVSSSVIFSWLDTCQDHTVVYVCFGSQAVLTNKQMEELTLGLEKSGVKFILCVKGKTKGHVDDEDYGDIPSGFEDRVTGRGLVIKGWAPQLGANAGMANGADQFANATLLVDELKVAIRVCEGDETVLESNDLVKFLGEVTSEKWIGKRDIAKNLSKAAYDAIGKEGSSFMNLDAFLWHVSELGLDV
ncbi:UDP-glycosyltransferase 89B1 [Forsythia ovata]|uniref:UDP-glycosyltransferase 89B1 n=1 Tax=Forsythia ovata TaxID=205694 RepID=A0ABD1R4Y8_9LAMI